MHIFIYIQYIIFVNVKMWFMYIHSLTAVSLFLLQVWPQSSFSFDTWLSQGNCVNSRVGVLIFYYLYSELSQITGGHCMLLKIRLLVRLIYVTRKFLMEISPSDLVKLWFIIFNGGPIFHGVDTIANLTMPLLMRISTFFYYEHCWNKHSRIYVPRCQRFYSMRSFQGRISRSKSKCIFNFNRCCHVAFSSFKNLFNTL